MFNHPFVVSGVRFMTAATAIAVLCAMSGCEKQSLTTAKDDAKSEVAWARAALERNPQLEVVATDTEARTFTVKHRGSGTVQVVSLDKLAAAPVSALTAESASAPAMPAAARESEPPVASAGSPPAAAPPAESTVASPAPGERSYTIQREGDQLRISGPGVSIVSANAANAGSSGAASPAAADSPIVCEGGRFLHLDRRNIRVNGTAVIARAGCELHITNSTIEATDTAIDAQDATVHISNSEVTGQNASIEADGKARLYIRGSTFHGIARRNDPAELNDQGGNTWR